MFFFSVGMSLTTDHLSSSENWPQSGDSSASDNNKIIAEEPEDVSKNGPAEVAGSNVEKEVQIPKIDNNNSSQVGAGPRTFLKVKNDLLDRSIQTSQFSEIVNLKKAVNASVNTAQPVKVVEPSFLSKLKKEGEIEKPVYVLYPNYVLPNLDFLNEKSAVDNVLFMPQKAPKVPLLNRRRPFSFNDIEMLKRRGFGHVKDWDSLNVLLPQEYRKILADVPEISSHIKPGMRDRPSFVR